MQFCLLVEALAVLTNASIETVTYVLGLILHYMSQRVKIYATLTNFIILLLHHKISWLMLANKTSLSLY